jgi:hypothetical protein
MQLSDPAAAGCDLPGQRLTLARGALRRASGRLSALAERLAEEIEFDPAAGRCDREAERLFNRLVAADNGGPGQAAGV